MVLEVRVLINVRESSISDRARELSILFENPTLQTKSSRSCGAVLCDALRYLVLNARWFDSLVFMCVPLEPRRISLAF